MKKRIIIVEDEIIIAEDIKQYLIKFGYEVVGMADNGEEAIKLAKELIPDMLFVDIRLHGDMSGVDAAREIHHQLEIPIVFLTAYADDDILEKAAESFPYGYLLKPIRERELYATLKMAFNKIENENKILNELAAAPKNIIVPQKKEKVNIFRKTFNKIFSR
ncbi:MAG TPA: response regulator [Candidatus Cloacimonetes bacterium]|nr:response regulator [Candidatus Cloacimonadota bacterium]